MGATSPDSTAYVEGLRDRVARPIPFTATLSTNTVILGPACLLVGYSIRETAGAAATVEFYSGADNTGELVAQSALAANGFDTQVISEEGVLCDGGLAVRGVLGTVKGTAWVKR